jgi:hypothetical protein
MRNSEFPPIEPSQVIAKLKTTFNRETSGDLKLPTESISLEEMGIVVACWATFNIVHQGGIALIRACGILQDFPK